MGIANSTDVLVVGGGPAGLFAAIAARRKGFQVVVADGARLPFDKACGEGLMPASVASLRRLGVEVPEADSMPIHGLRFLNNNVMIDASFRGGAGMGVRRTKLHTILAAHAEAAGVKLLWETPVNQVAATCATIDGGLLHFRYLIGADGNASTVRRTCVLSKETVSGTRYGFRQHYEIAPWADRVEVHWTTGCQIYVTPVGTETVGVAVLSRDCKLRLSQALPLFPLLARRLAGVRTITVEQGAVSASRYLDHVVSGKTALIGDASGSVDAITGDGLSIAFAHAEALAEAMEADDLALYEKAHRHIRRGPAMMARLLLTMDRHELIRRRVFSALSAKPALFTNMLAMHTGAASPQLAALTILSLGWNLLAG